MAITFDQMAGVLIPAMQELIWENMDEATSDNLVTWVPQIYPLRPTRSWENQISSAFNTRLWPEWDEQEPIHKTEWDDVDTSIFPLQAYVDSFPVTRRYLDYGDPNTAVQNVIPRLEDFIRNFLFSGVKTMAYWANDIFFDAFNGARYTGLDGRPLISHVHDAGVWSNHIAAALDGAGLQLAFDQASQYTDAHGVPLGVSYDTLIIPPALRNDAFTVINNTVLPGGTNDEKNPWYGVIRRVIEVPWWTATATNAPANIENRWFLMDSRKWTRRGFIGKDPQILDEYKKSPLEMEVIGMAEFRFGWHDWRGICGSNGPT